MYDDQMYLAWLQQQHPDDLPVELLLASTSVEDISLVSTSKDEEQAEQPNFITANPDPIDNTVTVSDSVIVLTTAHSHQQMFLTVFQQV